MAPWWWQSSPQKTPQKTPPQAPPQWWQQSPRSINHIALCQHYHRQHCLTYTVQQSAHINQMVSTIHQHWCARTFIQFPVRVEGFSIYEEYIDWCVYISEREVLVYKQTHLRPQSPFSNLSLLLYEVIPRLCAYFPSENGGVIIQTNLSLLVINIKFGING